MLKPLYHSAAAVHRVSLATTLLLAAVLGGCPAHRQATARPSTVEPRRAETSAPASPDGVPAAPPAWAGDGYADATPTPPPEVAEAEAAPPSDDAPDGARTLDALHPAIRTRALLLHKKLAAAGINIRFIHGFAPYKKRKRMGPGGMANWHNFGLAFDLNLAHRTSMADAKAHYAADKAVWETIGAHAKELGLVWGGYWRSSYDPFHFEWHPGHDSVINPMDLKSFLKVAGRTAKHWQRVWGLFPEGNEAP